jgi:hypothetical protein
LEALMAATNPPKLTVGDLRFSTSLLTLVTLSFKIVVHI